MLAEKEKIYNISRQLLFQDMVYVQNFPAEANTKIYLLSSAMPNGKMIYKFAVESPDQLSKQVDKNFLEYTLVNKLGISGKRHLNKDLIFELEPRSDIDQSVS